MEEKNESATAANDETVVSLFEWDRRHAREPFSTDAEREEYRRLLPVLRLLVNLYPELEQMAADMERLKNERTGCPVMADILRR